jgi:hypothetical protein
VPSSVELKHMCYYPYSREKLGTQSTSSSLFSTKFVQECDVGVSEIVVIVAQPLVRTGQLLPISTLEEPMPPSGDITVCSKLIDVVLYCKTS